MVGGCAIFNRIYSPVICIIFRFEVCAKSSLQTHEFSADYSVPLAPHPVPESKVTEAVKINNRIQQLSGEGMQYMSSITKPTIGYTYNATFCTVPVN